MCARLVGKCGLFFVGGFLILTGFRPADAGDLDKLVPSLKQGGYVIVFRHVATDESQQDVYPFRFDDMKAQRQLSDKGREAAREIGRSITRLGIPVGEVRTSKLNRAVETGKLLSGKDVITMDDLTDSGAGNPSSMANPTGGNARVGRAIKELVNTAPPAGMNTIVVTHKTNLADAFAKEWNDVKEGEAAVFKPAAGSASMVARIPAGEWSQSKEASR